MRDFDFHPPEDTVRTFYLPDDALLINNEATCVSQTRQPDAFGTMSEDLVLRHYAFANEWFKLNATFDLDGSLIQPGSPATAFAINCDITTPMLRIGSDISAVDLFLDVLVRTDGSYRIVDRDDFDAAVHDSLISISEAHKAEEGLARLLHLIDSGRLVDLLDEIPATMAALAPPAVPPGRTAIDLVPSVAPSQRPSWCPTKS